MSQKEIGIYDAQCRELAESTKAHACLLIVIGGKDGSGISYSAQDHIPLSVIISVLESLIVEMKVDAERIDAAAGVAIPYRSIFLTECEYAVPFGAFQEKKKQKVLVSVLDSYLAKYNETEFNGMLTELLDKYIQQRHPGATFIRKLYHRVTEEHVRYSFPGVEVQPDMALLAEDDIPNIAVDF